MKTIMNGIIMTRWVNFAEQERREDKSEAEVPAYQVWEEEVREHIIKVYIRICDVVELLS